MANGKRHGGDIRGNSYDRRARKRWLVREFGNGETCACVYCEVSLTFETLTVDRIRPGYDGGRYIHPNIVPSCYWCNLNREIREIGYVPPYLPTKRNGRKK